MSDNITKKSTEKPIGKMTDKKAKKPHVKQANQDPITSIKQKEENSVKQIETENAKLMKKLREEEATLHLNIEKFEHNLGQEELKTLEKVKDKANDIKNATAKKSKNELDAKMSKVKSSKKIAVEKVVSVFMKFLKK